MFIFKVVSLDEVHTADYCQFDSFNATCRHGSAVLMTSAQYGRPRIGRCVRRSYGVLGCLADVLGMIDWRCSGRRQCHMNVADIGVHGIQPCPDEFSSYLEASFKCVPGTLNTSFRNLFFKRHLPLCSFTLWPFYIGANLVFQARWPRG